jgi:hypothetical protein
VARAGPGHGDRQPRSGRAGWPAPGTHVRLPAGQHHTLTMPVPPTAAQMRKTPAEAVTAIDELLDHLAIRRTASSGSIRSIRPW